MKKNRSNDNILDLHGIRHKEALELVYNFLTEKESKGSFSVNIITGNSTVLQRRIREEILDVTSFVYYIPSHNLGMFIVEYQKW